MTRPATTVTHRTDAQIFAEARKALDERPSIPASARVHIDDGVAWLTGMVRRASERAEAEEVVRSVPGVKRVLNGMTLAQVPNEEGLEPPDAAS